MTKEQKRIKSEELLKNQEKIIQIWKSGDKVLALILGRSIMNDRNLLDWIFKKSKIFSRFQGWQAGLKIIDLKIDSLEIGIKYIGMNIRIYNNIEGTSTTWDWNNINELNTFTIFLNLICGPRPRKPKQI